MYTHRTLVSGRIPELLDNLKAEFESLAHDVNMYKMQRDDYERKLQAQLGELSNIQQTLYDLERNHGKIKSQYEEEILRLRRQVEMADQGQGQEIPPGSLGAFRPPGASAATPRTPTGASTPSTDKSTPSVPAAAGPLFNYPPPGSGLTSMDKGRAFPPPTLPSRGKREEPFGSYAGPAGATGQPFPALSPIAGLEGPATKLHKTEAGKGKDGDQPFTLTMPGIRDHPTTPKEPATRASSSTPGEREPPKESPAVPERDPPPENGKQQALRPASGPSTLTAMEETPKEGDEVRSPDGSDWIVGYNPSVQTNLNIDLLHDLDHNSVVCCVRFSHDGKYLATGCNRSAQIYDVETGAKVHTFSDDTGKDGDLYIRSVCFSPDGNFLATGAEDKTVKVWDVAHKRVKHTFIGHELDIYSLDFSNDGKFIVSGSGDKKAKIWDVEKGKCLFTLGNDEVGPKDGVTSVAISPDGRLVAAGSLDRIVRLWDAQTGYFLERYEGHLDSVYSVAFSPDGKSLASGSLDKTLKLWDLSGSRPRSRCRATFNGHKDFVLSVAFSPDGNWLISGSKDRAVQFWDPRTAVTHMMLQGHKNSVISVASSPAGGTFATGSGDYRARLWRYSNDNPR
jgi:glucose repression regulatory protein TUP1